MVSLQNLVKILIFFLTLRIKIDPSLGTDQKPVFQPIIIIIIQNIPTLNHWINENFSDSLGILIERVATLAVLK